MQRTAAITGASSGIGQAIALRLAKAGYRTIVGGRNEVRLSETAAAIQAFGADTAMFTYDVRSGDYVSSMFATCKAALGHEPSVFVLAAGTGLRGTLMTSDEEGWANLFDVNCLSALRQLRQCAEVFRLARARASSGLEPLDIVVIGSTIGRTVSAFNPIYGATKFALHSVVEALRQELCSETIRITLIEPGFVRTNFQSTAGYDMDWFGTLESEQGPFLAPEDVARAVEFVCEQPPSVHIDDIRIRPTRQRV